MLNEHDDYITRQLPRQTSAVHNVPNNVSTALEVDGYSPVAHMAIPFREISPPTTIDDDR